MKTLLLLCFVATSAFAQCDVATSLACPTTTAAASLTTTDCAAFDGSRFDVWQFAGTAGQTVTIDMSSTAFDTLLMLLDPSGKPVAQNDDALSTVTDSRVTFTLDSSGTWTVIANSLATTGTGSYLLSIDLQCAATGPRRRSVRRP